MAEQTNINDTNVAKAENNNSENHNKVNSNSNTDENQSQAGSLNKNKDIERATTSLLPNEKSSNINSSSSDNEFNRNEDHDENTALDASNDNTAGESTSSNQQSSSGSSQVATPEISNNSQEEKKEDEANKPNNKEATATSDEKKKAEQKDNTSIIKDAESEQPEQNQQQEREQQQKEQDSREQRQPKARQLQQQHQQQHQQPVQQQHSARTIPTATQYNSNTSTTEIVHSMFGTKVGLCWGDFSCQYNHIRGRLYASTEAVLFYSNLFGFEKKLCLRFDDVLQMQLFRSTSIQISVEEPQSQQQQQQQQQQGDDDSNSNNHLAPAVTTEYVFKAFADRNHTLQLLIDLWRKSQGAENIESSDYVNGEEGAEDEETIEASSSQERLPTFTTTQSSLLQTDAVVSPSRSLSPPTAGDDDSASLVQQNNSNNNIPHPPSILRSSKMATSQHQINNNTSTPPTRSDSTASTTRTTTPRRLFSESLPTANNVNTTRRTKSLPPIHRRRRESRERANSEGTQDTVTSTTSNGSKQSITETDDVNLDQNPQESDRAAWEEAKKKSAGPNVKETGIKPVTLSCSLNNFFRLFLADNAPYSLGKYQQSDHVKSLNVKISPWKQDKSEKELVRTIEFQHPVSKSLGVGPSHAPTKKSQRLRRYPGFGVCLTTSTSVEGLPGTDCFVVEDQWIVEAVPQNTSQVTLSTKFGANFFKRTFLKSIITKNINSGNKDWFEGYLNMVQRALKESANTGATPSMSSTNSDTSESRQSPAMNESTGEMGGAANAGAMLPMNANTLMLVLGAAYVLLLLCFLAAVVELRSSRRMSEGLLEELRLLRLEHGQMLELMLKREQS